MIRPLHVVILLALVSFPCACEAGNSGPTARAEKPTSKVTAAAKVEAPGKTGECASGSECGAPGACGAAEGAGCGCGSEPPRDTSIDSGTDPATGKPMQVVGAKLGGAAPVSVRELLGDPDAFAGKRVRLEGDVAAMCHHKRRWFALQDPGDRSGRYVRVMAAPAFLVPPESIGKKARTEGTVEVIELPPTTQQHLAREHDLGQARPEPQKRVVLRATGAEII